jgi:hypothetical protein
MTQRPHLAFGGELVDPRPLGFRGLDAMPIAHVFPKHAGARDGWHAGVQRTVGHAHERQFVTHPHRPRDEATPTSSTEDLVG